MRDQTVEAIQEAMVPGVYFESLPPGEGGFWFTAEHDAEQTPRLIRY